MEFRVILLLFPSFSSTIFFHLLSSPATSPSSRSTLFSTSSSTCTASMQYDTNHIISVSLARARDYVDKGTRTNVDFHGISNHYLPISIGIVSHTVAKLHVSARSHSRDLARQSVATIISQTYTAWPRIQLFPGQLIVGWANRLVLNMTVIEEMELILSSLIHLYFQSPTSRLPRYSTRLYPCRRFARQFYLLGYHVEAYATDLFAVQASQRVFLSGRKVSEEAK